MSHFSIDQSLCTRCGLCVSDCVMRIIEQDDNGLPYISPEKAANCFACQHCLAVCPTGAVSVLGKNPADSQPIPGIGIPSFEQMDHLVRSRRSVRHYKDENVDPALIETLLKSLAHAPTGVNRQELTFNVIDDKEVMRQFSDTVLTALAEAAANEDVPGHFAIAKQMASYPRDVAASIIFRTAPHALIISAPPDAPCGAEDVALALAYFELLAQSAGLGTVWWGYLRAILMAVPSLKSVLGIPDDHHFYAMLFGIPAIQFARTTQKEDVAKVRRIEM